MMLAGVVTSFFFYQNPDVQQSIKSIPEDKPIKEIFSMSGSVFLWQGANIILAFGFSTMMFPGVIIAQPLKSVPNIWYIPILVFVYNLTDALGKLTAGIVKVVSAEKLVWTCLSRGVLVIFLCFIGYGTFDNFFVQDWFILFILIIFGFSNGLFGCYAMMYNPQVFEDKNTAFLRIFVMLKNKISQGV